MCGNLTIGNNLFYKPLPLSGSAANFIQLVGGHDITVQHNTLVQPGSPVVSAQQTSGMVFKDNIVAHYQYGMQCAQSPYTLATCWPGLVMTGNVMIDTRWDRSSGSLASLYPAGSYYPASAADVGFQDLANDNYVLSSSSAYRNLASDGTDAGVNMSALLAALGNNTLPSPTPTTTPTPTQSSTPTPKPTPKPQQTTTIRGAATFVQVDSVTQGNWKDVYGVDGYQTINDAVSYPQYAQVSSSGAAFTWASSTTEARGLQKAALNDRIAATWYQQNAFSIDVNLTDGALHRVAVYCLDWDAQQRAQTLEVVDAATNAVLDSQTVSSFAAGKYLVWDLKGHVKLNVTRINGSNAVVSGLYFGVTGTPVPTPTRTPKPPPTSLTVSITSPTTNATYSLGSSVTLKANASDMAGNVTNMSFRPTRDCLTRAVRVSLEQHVCGHLYRGCYGAG
jgi:hypothetical protein